MALSDAAKLETAAFVKERDEILLACDIDRMIAFYAKHNPGIQRFSSRKVAEIAMHQTRTAVRSLPMPERVLSKKWLTERGYASLDDGELLP